MASPGGFGYLYIRMFKYKIRGMYEGASRRRMGTCTRMRLIVLVYWIIDHDILHRYPLEAQPS